MTAQGLAEMLQGDINHSSIGTVGTSGIVYAAVVSAVVYGPEMLAATTALGIAFQAAKTPA